MFLWSQNRVGWNEKLNLFDLLADSKVEHSYHSQIISISSGAQILGTKRS